MALAEKRNKDQAMAAMMKAAGIERTSGRCPICQGIVGIGRPGERGEIPHVALCRRQKVQKPRKLARRSRGSRWNRRT